MIRIAFLQSEYEDKLGVLYLIAFLKAGGHDAEIFIERHGYYTYDFESHIPFMMWMLGTIPPGVRVKNQFSNVDILPTLIDFLRLDFTDTVQGKSLIPLMQDPGSYVERYVFCEAVNQTAVRSLSYRFIDSHELYLYESDPEEQFNRAAHYPDLCARGTGALTEFREQCRRLRSEKGLDKPERLVDLTEEDINKLRDLGYIN